MNRILVIRGGAIGDFILTLPALKALREVYPHAWLEILGYKHIAVIAENRFYAQSVRSIEYGALSSFFAKNAELPAELGSYFADFDLIISYLYDPDAIFETNLRRCGVEHLVCGPAKIENSVHAARQLAKPVEDLGINVVDLAARLFPSAEDRDFALEFLRDLPRPIFAIHPGSGSAKKNWPIENWIALSRSGGFPTAAACLERRPFLIISGEADESNIARLEREWQDRNACFAKNLPLPKLAAVLENSIFIGHDSGISHLAAAAGAKCILLFGPTDPDVWAPQNENVSVIRSKTGALEDIDVVQVEYAVAALLCGARRGL
jgi:heptosyltransferase-2